MFLFLVVELKRVWKNLRDAYKKCKTNRGKVMRSGSKATKLPTCAYFEILSFLSDNLEESETSVTTNVDARDEIQMTITGTNDSVTNVQEPKQQQIGRKSLKKRKLVPDEVDTALINSLSQINKQIQDEDESQKKKSEKESSNTYFCKSIIDTLDTLSPEENMEARIKIQQILFEIKFRK